MRLLSLVMAVSESHALCAHSEHCLGPGFRPPAPGKPPAPDHLSDLAGNAGDDHQEVPRRGNEEREHDREQENHRSEVHLVASPDTSSNRDEFGVHPIGTMAPRPGSRHPASQLPANERTTEWPN